MRIVDNFFAEGQVFTLAFCIFALVSRRTTVSIFILTFIMKINKDFMTFLRREDVTLFVGSGCSMASGAPSSKILSDRIYSILDEEYKEYGRELAKTSEALVVQDQNSRERLNDVIVDAFSNLKPSKFHENLLMIPHIRTIITTNYDTLIEQAYSVRYFQSITNDTELARAIPNNVQLLKIHGDLKHLDDIIITESDYRHFLDEKPNPLLWNRVITEFTTKHVVFVGYSAEDANVLTLIEQVRRYAGDAVKKMFIIVPELNAVQKSRLNQLGVTHISGLGNDFLESVIQSLKNTFGEDKYNHVCTHDTLIRFGLLNGLKISIESDGIHTSISSVKGLNGEPTSMQLHFDTKSKDLLAGRPAIKANELIKGFSVPMYRLTPEERASFEIRVNGLRLNGQDELQDVLLGPSVENVDIAFISNSRGISCRANAKKYTDKGICHLCIPTPLYNMEILLDLASIANGRLNGKLNTTLNEEPFTNLEGAIKWTKLLTEWINCSDLKFHLGNHILFECVKMTNDEVGGPLYNEWFTYCNNLEEIERLSGKLFSSYEAFSSDSLHRTRIVKSYFKKEAFISLPRKAHEVLCFDVDKGLDTNGLYTLRLKAPIEGPVNLCGMDFTIPEERVLIIKCSVLSCEPIDEVHDAVRFNNLNHYVQYEYTDGADEQFSGIVIPTDN